MSFNQFPTYPQPSLSREQVVSYLVPFRNQGWDIYQGNHSNEFIIKVTNRWNVVITYEDNQWVVFGGLGWARSHPENLLGLDAAIKSAVQFVSLQDGETLDWHGAVRSVRLNLSEPATNVNKLVTLIGTSTIEAVFDAYLDNKGLANLLDLVSLGVQVSTSIRLLTSKNMVHPPQGTPRLTASYLQMWLNQLGCTSPEVRYKAYRGHQRRFLLLGGGQSLIVGPSFNNLAVNEAVHLDPDTADRSFFDSEWQNAEKFNV